jgi:hypothetical protein
MLPGVQLPASSSLRGLLAEFLNTMNVMAGGSNLNRKHYLIRLLRPPLGVLAMTSTLKMEITFDSSSLRGLPAVFFKKLNVSGKPKQSNQRNN